MKSTYTMDDIEKLKTLIAECYLIGTRVAYGCINKTQRNIINSIYSKSLKPSFKGLTYKQYNFITTWHEWLKECDGKTSFEILTLRRGGQMSRSNRYHNNYQSSMMGR